MEAEGPARRISEMRQAKCQCWHPYILSGGTHGAVWFSGEGEGLREALPEEEEMPLCAFDGT